MKYRINVDGHVVRWRKNNRPHREYGPAWEYSSGLKEWCKDGQTHCIDGPAVEYSSGCKEWHINDIQYIEEEFKRIIFGKYEI